MAWHKVRIDHNEVIYMGHAQGDMFSIPFSSGLKDGDTFKSDGRTFEVMATLDVADRGEVLLINAMEVKNDKPKTRGNAAKSGKPTVHSESNDGRSSED